MGKDAYRKEKEYMNAVRENKRFPSYCSNDKVARLKSEWKAQEIIDDNAKQKEIDYYYRKIKED